MRNKSQSNQANFETTPNMRQSYQDCALTN